MQQAISSVEGLNIIRDIYKITKEPDPADFYRNAPGIFWATRQPYDSYEDINRTKFEDYLMLPYEEICNLLLASDPGTYKTTVMKRMMVYYYLRGYKIVVIDAKSNDMRFAVRAGQPIRLARGEQPIGLPLFTCVPSYVTSRSKGIAAVPESEFKNYNQRITIPSKALSTRDEWQTVLGATETGAEIMQKHANHNIDIRKIQQLILRDPKLHIQAKNSLLLRLGNIINDDVFDAKSHHQLNIEKIWLEDKIPMVSLFRRDPDYQKITVSQIIKQEWLFSEKTGHKFNIINFWDDCQMYFDSDKHNYANEMVSNTIDYGRTYKFSNVFAFQKPKRFSEILIESVKHYIIGYLQNPEAFSFLGSEAMWEIEGNKQHFSNYMREDGAEIKNVRYCHIPQNVNMIQTGYPLGSICGHFRGG